MNELQRQAEETVGESILGARWSEGISRATGADSGRSWMLKVYPAGQDERVLAETTGLRCFRGVHELDVPEVVWSGGHAFLMEYLETKSGAWNAFGFGKALATLHGRTNDSYGAPVDTFCGPTRQVSGWSAEWEEFFWNQRLVPLMSGLSPRAGEDLPPLLDTVHDLYKQRWAGSCSTPGLVHGDLWQGNVLKRGQTTGIIDPAFYYGDPEVDLGMLTLFGTPPPDFWEGYATLRKLEEGYLWRLGYYNLYHLLNHSVLFGGNYPDLLRRKIHELLTKF